ncbi:hypothetical protein TNCV_1363661 [Trichonephila clavipes]|uniref:Uncharacterized protein n=1 Tax=Trichonephila clavipes TaxID=2585209 RepID=A0A8X6RXX3_TRICX|nr:hypothetical protein TNCV_1363661 [Trichonephila clavipes]
MNERIGLEEEMRSEKEKWLGKEQMQHVQEEHKMRMKAEEQKRLQEERSTRGLLETDLEILNHGQVTRTILELASFNYRTTPTRGRSSSRQNKRASLPYTIGIYRNWARTRDTFGDQQIAS